MRTNREKSRGEQNTRSTVESGQRHRNSPKKDFWDSIAEEVAEGYGARNAATSVRNRDQEPNDNRRGDEVE